MDDRTAQWEDLLPETLPTARRNPKLGGAVNLQYFRKLHDRAVYVMDNHGLAAYCWHQELAHSLLAPLRILHVDAHADWGPGRLEQEELTQRLQSLDDLDKYLALTQGDRPVWQWDAYFSPYLRAASTRGSIDAVVPTWEFHNFEMDELPDISVMPHDLATIDAHAIGGTYDVVNLDIDAFCCPGESESESDIPFEGWEGRVSRWASTLSTAVTHAHVVTIALSPTTVNDDGMDISLDRSIMIANRLLEELSLPMLS